MMSMDHEEFRAAWERCLCDSKLRLHGPDATESIEQRRLDRIYEVFVEPLGGQDAQPFFVTAKLSWRWTALLTAWAASTEEDMLSTLFPRSEARDLKTEKPCVRVDIVLSATLPWGKPLPLPAKAVWARWVQETMGRLEDVERLLPEQTSRENDDGMLEVLAWNDLPEVEASCAADGSLMLTGVRIAAGQLVEVPRKFDDPHREPDDDVDEQLTEMFARVRASLSAWMQALDHLRRL
jgi:hypothetical protein